MDKLKLHTTDIAAEKFAALAALFPNAVSEAIKGYEKDENGEDIISKPIVERSVDPEILQQEINTHVLSDKEERYQFTWPDKRKSIMNANSPINATLRPCREESVNFDTTENLYIEGDNLEVLKLLRETYLGRVKMIYIDPPYNTGSDFVYNDDFTTDGDEWADKSGDYDNNGNRLVKNPDSNGRFHTDWLNMIYPRLKIARDLLSDNGIILINMDENEITNLQKVCIEIFGEINDLGTIVWDKRNPKGAVRGISYQHEYILAYAKNKIAFSDRCRMLRPKKNAVAIMDKAKQFFDRISQSYTFENANRDFSKWVSSQKDFSGGEKAYNAFDEFGNVYRPVSMAAPDKPETRSHRPLIHPITGKPCPVPAKGWRFPNKSMDELLANGEILFGSSESTQPTRKYLLKENMYDQISSLLYYGGSDLDLLTKLGIPFETPKVVSIIKEHIQSFTDTDDIILDFFSGSATTAHAVMQLNAENGGKRKYIMVQLQEEVTPDSSKAAYDFLSSTGKALNICEIGKERIRRAGRKIVDESSLERVNLDIGFRVLKLDSTNMKDVYYTPDEIAELIINQKGETLIDNIKEDRTDEDLLFQVMLDLGVPLSARMWIKSICGVEVHFVEYGDGLLIACFGKVDNEIIKQIAKEKPHFAVFRDDGFESDSAFVNTEQIFATYSPDTKRRVL